MYRKVLAPLDGSELAECTLEHLRTLVRGCNIPEVIILRVIEPLPAQVLGALSGTSSSIITDLEACNGQDAQNYIQNVSDLLKKDGIIAKAATVQGNAADEILNYAHDNDVDLIIMSSHGRSGINKWFMGSVATRVLEHSNIPVLTIIPKGYRAK